MFRSNKDDTGGTTRSRRGTRAERWRESRLARAIVTRRWLMLLVTSLAVGFAISPRIALFTADYAIGSYAERAIKAPRTFFVEDAESTHARREEAARRTPPVFDYDSARVVKSKETLAAAFARMREFLGVGADDGEAGVGNVNIVSRKEMAAAQERFTADVGARNLDRAQLQYLARSGYSTEVLDRARAILDEFGARPIVSDVGPIDEALGSMPPDARAFVLRDVATGRETVVADPAAVSELDRVLALVRARMNATPAPPRAEQVALRLSAGLIAPNLTINMAETDRRRADARAAVVPSQVKYAKNQIIVGEGERITHERLEVLRHIREHASPRERLANFVAVSALTLLLVTVMFTFAERNIRKFRLLVRDVAFIAFALVAGLLGLRIGVALSTVIAGMFDLIPPRAIWYMYPAAAGVMAVRILLNSEIAVLFAVLFAVLAGLLAGGDMSFTIFVLAASFAGAHAVRQAARRARIARAGLFVGAVNVAVVLCLAGSSGFDRSLTDLAMEVAGAFVGGASSGLVVLAVLSIFEWAFGYTSDISVLELASLNHPLLKEMVVRAPGTYRHSVMVGMLAEAGAEAVGANPLVAKVAGLYHDAGKINKPQYFSENCPDGEDLHANLYPSMSCLILTAHVREGVELARRHRLGERITDIIREHHGTSLIRECYDRAKKREDADHAVKETDFRYPGPKPRTREAALVMLSNAVESACRRLVNPTPARLEQTVEQTVNGIFLDGQLAECDLTLQDLNRLHRAFVKTITGVYHSRIEYPEPRPGEPNERSLGLADGTRA
ncbi:HDIG domain-containing protein [bacterium]|nr:HDIG domain-containing protein [bacterium]